MRDLLRTVPLTGWIMVAIGVLVILSLGYCTYDANRDRRAAERLASANAETFRATLAARDAAALERLSDAQSINDLDRSLTDAVSPLPDARPSDRRIALQCERLRQAGTDVSRLPACSGPGR